MNSRMESTLHRWLPLIAAVALGLGVLDILIAIPLLNSRQRQELQVDERWEKVSAALRPAWVVASARTALEQVATLATSLDGNPEILQTIAEAVAQNDTIQRLWVVNDQGAIIYFGKERPKVFTVEKLAPQYIHLLLEGVPPDLLGPEERLAIVTHAAIWTPQEDSEGFYGWVDRHLYTEVRRIPGGLVAVAAQTPVPGLPAPLSERTRLLGDLNARILVATFLLYWLSLPLWVTLDARRRQERAGVWGIFTVVGNAIAVIIYLLVRRET